MAKNFQKAERNIKIDGEYKLLSYASSSESVEMTDGTDLQTKMDSVDNDISNEVSRATAKENEITNNLSSHTSNTSNPHGTTKSDVGLGNVGNFKAVSTVASQGLSDTEKSNARANIGAGTSSFSGSYNDLTNKPTIPTVGNGTITITQNGTTKGTFTTNQSGNTTIALTDNNTTYGVATQSANGLESAADKKKLDGIATGAEVNQNAFSNVVVGSTTITADSKTDTLTLAGSNVTLTPDATNDKVTIGITKDNVISALGYTPGSSVDNNTTYTLSKSGSTITLTGSDGSKTSVTDADTDTHYTSHLYVGASGGNANATTATSNPYLLCVDNTTNRNSIQLKAGTNIGISAVNGVVTFNNTYSLPTASSSTLGGIKVGTNLTISSGVLSSTQRSVSSTYTSTITNASTTAFSQEGAYNMYTALNESLIDFVYPIGAIYISVNSTSPATLFGGTWVAITEGYYLKSITSGTGGTYTNATNVGSTTLTVNQIPGHTHSISNNNYQAGDSGGGGNWGYAINNAGGGNVTGNALVAKSTGGGQSHTHSMGTPATMTVYMWKRTA